MSPGNRQLDEKKFCFLTKCWFFCRHTQKRGKRTHCLLRFPLFGLILCLVSKQSFSGTPVFPALPAPPGHFVPPLLGAAGPGPHYTAAKSQTFPLACMPPGPNDSKPSDSGGLCPLDKGRTRVLYRLFSSPCMGQKNPDHPLRRFRRKRPFIPAAAAPAGRAGALAAKWRCDPPPRRPAL